MPPVPYGPRPRSLDLAGPKNLTFGEAMGLFRITPALKPFAGEVECVFHISEDTFNFTFRETTPNTNNTVRCSVLEAAKGGILTSKGRVFFSLPIAPTTRVNIRGVPAEIGDAEFLAVVSKIGCGKILRIERIRHKGSRIFNGFRSVLFTHYISGKLPQFLRFYGVSCKVFAPSGEYVKKCRNCLQEGHLANGCPNTIICDFCRGEGHKQKDCPKKATDFPPLSGSSAAAGPSSRNPSAATSGPTPQSQNVAAVTSVPRPTSSQTPEQAPVSAPVLMQTDAACSVPIPTSKEREEDVENEENHEDKSDAATDDSEETDSDSFASEDIEELLERFGSERASKKAGNSSGKSTATSVPSTDVPAPAACSTGQVSAHPVVMVEKLPQSFEPTATPPSAGPSSRGYAGTPHRAIKSYKMALLDGNDEDNIFLTDEPDEIQSAPADLWYIASTPKRPLSESDLDYSVTPPLSSHRKRRRSRGKKKTSTEEDPSYTPGDE